MAFVKTGSNDLFLPQILAGLLYPFRYFLKAALESFQSLQRVWSPSSEVSGCVKLVMHQYCSMSVLITAT